VALGSVHSVLVCQQVVTATAQDEAVCGAAVAGQAFAPRLVTSYLLDPAQIAVLEAAVGPFDYAYAAGLWAFGFSTIVGLYAMTYGIGHVLGMIRRG
jgi:hypothetical protein